MVLPLLASLVIHAQDYPTLPDAVDACDGVDCTVIVPPGLYQTSREVTPKSHTRIIGEGNVTVEPDDTFSAFEVDGYLSHGSTVVGSTGTEANIVTVADSSPFSVGTMFVAFGDGLYDQVGIVSAVIGQQLILRDRLGVPVSDGSPILPVVPVEDVEIDNVNIVSGGRSVFAHYTRGLVLRDVSSVNTDGVMLYYSADASVLNGYEKGCSYGLYVVYADAPTVVGNVFDHSYSGNMVFGNVNNGLLASNAVSADRNAFQQGLNGDGITFGNTWNTRVVTNTLLNSSCYGMWIQTSTHNFFANNIVTNSYASGLFIDQSMENMFVGNQFLAIQSQPGIVASASTGNVIADSRLLGNSQGFEMFSTGSTAFVNNTVAGNANASTMDASNTAVTILRNAFDDLAQPQIKAQLVCSDLDDDLADAGAPPSDAASVPDGSEAGATPADATPSDGTSTSEAGSDLDAGTDSPAGSN